MAIEITKISGLVFANVLQYERLIESETNLEYISFHDALTGLYNRTFFNAFVEENPDVSPFVVFSFDVDGLKHVNDSFGHSEGDKLIRKAANTLKRCCRSDEDLLARVGGDEFIAVLRDFDPSSVDTILNRLKTIIRSDNAKTKTPHLKLSISAGFAYPKSKKETFDSLVHRADSRMYENKRLKKEKARNEER
jgi:diguanylate cyclase (GGDEF)-like protein